MDKSSRHHPRQMTNDHQHQQQVPLPLSVPDTMSWEGQVASGVVFPVTHNLCLIPRKHIQTQEQATRQPTLFKNIKVMKDEKSMRNCPRLKDTEDMTSECEVGSWTGSRKDSRKWRTPREAWPRLRALHHARGPALPPVLTRDADVRCSHMKGTWQLFALCLQIFCRSKMTSR